MAVEEHLTYPETTPERSIGPHVAVVGTVSVLRYHSRVAVLLPE